MIPSENIGDQQNGNFLATLEYLAKFDPIIAKHFNEKSNKSRGKISYLSSTIYEECVLIMGNKLLKMIIKEIKCAKYFFIVVDSSRDFSC